MLVIVLLGTVFVLPKSATNRLSAEQVERSSNQQNRPVSAGASERSPRSIAARALTSQLPLSFQPNHGQTDRRVKFLSRGSGYELFLTSTQAVFSLRQPDTGRNRRASSALRLTLKNANAHARVKAVDPLPGVENYLIGNNPKRWQTDVPSYRRVTYEEVYPGIDLTYYGNQQQLEYDFELAAGADPGAIRLACDGVDALAVDSQGDLVMTLNGGEVRQHKPIVYQDIDGERKNIDGRFVIEGREIGFEIASYDTSRPLVIDPTLVYSTYLGGTGDDSGSSIDVDDNGNIYVTGTTSSTNFPTHNPFQASNAGGLADAFVTKLDPTGANVIYSTYIGGSGQDRADAIFVDKATGAVYLAGRADSTSIDFPTTPGAFATTYRGGDFDAFVLKLNPAGNSLAYSTFLGGGDNDSAIGIAADASGAAYVTGGTRSPGFPTTATAYQFSVAGDTDAYLLKFNATGSAILYSTLLGGGATDRGSSVKIDNSGNAYLVGYTSSQDFPTESAFQNSLGGKFRRFRREN